MKINKARYRLHVLSKISDDTVYCGRCDMKWPKEKLGPDRAYDIYIRDPNGHVLFIFCYDCDAPHRNGDIGVHERRGRKVMFCPNLHKVRREITEDDLIKLMGAS